ncbi:MAG: efflux RND transporter periplasmic adaptor subunit [Gammaproteobacteria bacterium]
MSESLKDTTNASANAPVNNNTARRRKPLLILAAVVLLAIISYGLYWAVWGRFHTDTDDAYVNGNIVTVAPQVAGTVIQIDADDTQLINRGDPLVQLDPTDARIALQKAEASLGQAVRQVRSLYANARELHSAVHDRQIALQQALADYRRAEDLKKIRGISTQDFQHAQTAYQSAESALNQTQHQLSATLAAVSNTTLETHPAVKLAEAQLRDAYLALKRTTVLSPVTGYVANRAVQLGQQVTPGTAMLAVIPLNEVWVDANFKETELAHVRIGQPVRLESDLYGGSAVYHGHVVGLAPGTGNAFALLPPQNATGNWIKVVQRLPVRIALDPKEFVQHPLRLGLTMNVSVNTRDQGGPLLAPTPVTRPDYTTNVYENQSTGVQALIQTIIRRNASTVARTRSVARPH